MDAEAARKEAIEAAKPKRPTELRNDPQCFVWNGEKRCFTCKTQVAPPPAAAVKPLCTS